MKTEKPETAWIQSLAGNLERTVSQAFVGSKETVALAVAGLLGGLHILIEDIPGVGKTTLALALAKAAGMNFSRIQFTPDMLPGDVLGMNVWDPALGSFVYREGPIHAQCILADELNRTSPRTQAAFLEAMQEGKVTIDGKTRSLPDPFFMIATQNPESFTGTFPLPEAELDRFGMSFKIGYPSAEHENEILRRKTSPGKEADIAPVCSPEDIAMAREAIETIHVSDPVREYIVELVRATRQSQDIRLGASPRAALCLQQAARTRAAADGRSFVIPEDAEGAAQAVLSHRIQLSSQARLTRTDSAKAVAGVCSAVPKPTGL